MTAYLKWNDALARHFFRSEFAGQAVWLYVTDELIDELRSPDGGAVISFVEAVKAGVPWVTNGSLCQRALQAYRGWRERSLEYPPYIGYLSLFVLAAGLEGDFAKHAYYPRLRALLNERGEGALPSFARMLELWDDLEQWSTQDRNGELGLFEARIVGGHFHVGLPIAQTILSEHERAALPQMFAKAGLDPTSPPPDDELARMLRAQGGTVLRPRTRELVRTRHDPESYAVLLDTVVEELAAWDGAYDVQLPSEPAAATRRTFGSLRLCVDFDYVSGRLRSSLRCRVQREFPAGGLRLRAKGIQMLSCIESGLPGWSSPLADSGTGEQFDARVVDWSEGLRLTEERLGWRFGLTHRSVRVLVKGVAEGLPGLIEVGQVPRSQPVYFLYRDVDWPRLEQWAEKECQGFRTHRAREGMRPGWQFASCAEVNGDKRVRSSFPELALSERVRLRLVGGIRSDRGPNYFPFALPCIVLEGGVGREAVLCNDQDVPAAKVSRSYLLPDGLPNESRIRLEARRDGQILKRLSIYVTGEFEWRQEMPEQLSNEWGGTSADGGTGVAGALTIGCPPTEGFERSVMLAPGLDPRARHMFFIGRVPGQIYSWPQESAANWFPVWVIPMERRRGRVIYCGNDIDSAGPALDRFEADRHRLQLWKDILWYGRKRIKEPEEPLVVALWRSYVEAARRV